MADYTLFGNDVSGLVEFTDTGSRGITNGIEFYVTSTAWIKGIRSYISFNTAWNALLTAKLYRTDGTIVPGAEASLQMEGYTGSPTMRTIEFAEPVELTPNVRYIASVGRPSDMGHARRQEFWSTGPGSSGLTSGPIVAPNSSNTGGRPQGPYEYGNRGVHEFPNQAFMSSHWGVDVLITDVGPDTPPVADAGPDQSVNEGDTVNLDGSASSDAEDGAVSIYSWTVSDDGGTGLTTADLTGATTATPSFTAPAVTAETPVILQLEVTDSAGLSDTDTVTVTVSHVVSLSMAPLTYGFDLSLSVQPVASLGLELSYGYDLDATVRRVWTTTAVEFAYGMDLDTTLNRVWHTASMEPLTYGFDLELNATVGQPPPGLNVYTRRKLYVPAQRRGVRFIVQDILTGEFLEWDLPLMGATISYTLSGSKTISGVIDPEYPRIADLDMRSRGTWIHAEADGQILGSGILQPGSIDDAKLTIDAAGFTSYAHLIPYRGMYSGIQVDPLEVVRHIWSHIQSYPTGNMGILLDNTASPVRIGTEEIDEVEFETGQGEQVSFEANGPYKLNYWENTNCGQEIENLFKECGAEFREVDYWNDDKTEVLHRVRIGYPRIGKRQPLLKFAQDENIRDLIPLSESDDLGCSEVIVTGAGEGASMIQGSYIGTPDGRLRVPVVVEDSSITRTERARAFAQEEYLRRSATEGVESIIIDIHHENAKFGTFAEGDDILVQGEIAYRGRISLWHRVTGYDYNTEEGLAVLTLRRSDTFRYG